MHNSIHPLLTSQLYFHSTKNHVVQYIKILHYSTPLYSTLLFPTYLCIRPYAYLYYSQ